MSSIKKEKKYNIIIIFCYLYLCFIIWNQKEYPKHEKVNWVSYNEKTILKEKDYLFTINIDKINLKKDVYDLSSNKNNVEENVTILEGSILPDQENSIMFIAAHSGEGEIAYFDNLDQLQINDAITILYQNNLYQYQVTEIWEEEKTGYIHVNKSQENQIILTTCSKTNKQKQLIINCIQKE